MKKLGLNVLRAKFLEFFEGKGHLRHSSFPLVPQGDNSLLLINSGMAPLKPYFSGDAVPPRVRMVTCQKCIRTPDIERVGKTSRHGTFFEMLGNFSFGDYFKNEACTWAWEFLTEVLEIPKEKLYITVFLDDDEAAEIWEKKVGVDPAHISRLGRDDNFWEIGMGPCGPCSEIYYDRGEKYGCGSDDYKPGCECDRFVEIWNLVFTQFNNDGQGNYTELASKNIDTGMGLERLACIMQGVDSLFDVDTVMNITKHVSEIAGVSYGESRERDISLRVITDHIRSTTMMICDGVLPSNEGRGYVLRRLLRRAARHGRLLGVTEPFLFKVCDTVIKESGEAYPELLEKSDYIKKVIRNEEENFSKTIDSGIQILESILSDMERRGRDLLSGEDSFKLYDTYGFPIDLTLEILTERGMKVDRKQFDLLMEQQRQRARAATESLGDFGWAGLDLGLSKDEPTIFTGYESLQENSKILAIVSDDELRSAVHLGDKAVLVLDKTPFYAESGGQVADTGVICAGEFEFQVESVHKSPDNKYMHSGIVKNGDASVGLEVKATVDKKHRQATSRAHSCTHILHKALRNILGTHVEQAGSLVTPDFIRFDFTHFSAVTRDELRLIDEQVNEIILEGLPITVCETSQEKAKEMGAMALFGEKYGDVVRVVKMGDYSTELCGGTHLDNTAKVGSYRTLAEFSVASGVRRIEASVGMGVLAELSARMEITDKIAGFLKTKPMELEAKVMNFITEMRENKKLLEKFRAQSALTEIKEYLNKANEVKGLKVITAKLGKVRTEDMRKMGDFFREHSDTVALLASVQDEKISFMAVCGKNAIEKGIKAGNLIKYVTSQTGGSGGGKPDSAMGGGKDLSKLTEVMDSLVSYVDEHARD